jgi:hypothetical protein
VSSCKKLLATLPSQLDKNVRRRPVSGDATRTAAWGDPAVTLRCGVPLPDQSLEPIVIDNLSFVTTKHNGVTSWTTSNRAVNVAIDVPSSYTGEQGYLVTPLVALMLAALPAPAAAPGP